MAENCLRSKSCYTLVLKARKGSSPGERARSLGWIRTLACGAGDPGFKSQRARQASKAYLTGYSNRIPDHLNEMTKSERCEGSVL